MMQLQLNHKQNFIPGDLIINRIGVIYFIVACKNDVHILSTNNILCVYLLSRNYSGWWNIDYTDEFWQRL